MLSKERIKELLDQRHAMLAQRDKEYAECDAALANFKAIMARNNSRTVTTKKQHLCHLCNSVIPKGAQATYTPGRIAAKSSRNTDAAFTASTYTCTSCMEKQ